jgi:hypothetical protein
MTRRLVWLAALAPAVALAQSVTVEVGGTAKVNVGIARGVLCTDSSIVSATSDTDKTGESNVVTLTGLEVGTTTCRAGNVALGSVHVIEVTVKPKQKPKPKPEAPMDPESRPE